MANEITYTVAFEELQQIVRDMEDGEITVDELAIKVKRAAELIKVCKNIHTNIPLLMCMHLTISKAYIFASPIRTILNLKE